MQQLTNSGSLRLIKNAELVRQISNYAAFTRHLDDDYAEDQQRAAAAASLANEIVNKNYPDLEPTKSFSWRTPYSFPPTELRENYSNVNLPLLTDDIKKIGVMMNIYIDLTSEVLTRSDQELPRLKEYARELIELLEAEYPQ